MDRIGKFLRSHVRSLKVEGRCRPIGIYSVVFVIVIVVGLRNTPWWEEKVGDSAQGLPSSGRMEGATRSVVVQEPVAVESGVFAFYYPWYGNPETDNRWLHWNHEVLDGRSETKRYFQPPADIGAGFYPELGLYSSQDDAITKIHMEQCRRVGIETLVVSWWGRGTADSQGSSTDRLITKLLDLAAHNGIKIAIHLEPYPNRTAKSVMEDNQYLHERIFRHPAAFRSSKHNNRPIVFVYDSYLIDRHELRSELQSADQRPGGGHYPLLIGLVVEPHDVDHLIEAGMDGFYTYFATDGFTYGSSMRNWNEIAIRAKANQSNPLLWIPSVGPGYDDSKIRPWNARNRRERGNGAYYNDEWAAALGTHPDFISITSYNEWHEGTQIEPAASGKENFKDYESLGSNGYLDLTQQWINKFLQQRDSNR